jgi:small subunit ribosomal protein S18
MERKMGGRSSGRSGGRFDSKTKKRPFKKNYMQEGEMLYQGKCRFCTESISEIDYKDVNRLKRYVTEKGKILSSRATGTCARHQRQLANAVKRARFVALMPYVGE